MALLNSSVFSILFLALNLQSVRSISDEAQSDKQKSIDLYNSVQNQEFFQDNIYTLTNLAADASTQIFEQCLDHFGGSCSETFNQRFWAWDGYYSPGSGNPIFFYLGNEDDASGAIGPSWAWINNYGKQYNAYCVAVEHRFYGSSSPSDPYGNREYLTSQQAIADYAFFIKSLKQANSSLASAPVVVFGGSYGGNLATWFRTIHPDLIFAAVASSAPLESQYEYPEYIGTIAQVIKDSQPDDTCYNNIKSVFRCIENLVYRNECDSTNVEAKWLAYELNNYCFPLDFSDNYTAQNFFQGQTYYWTTEFNAGVHANALCPILNREFNKNSNDIIKTYSRFLRKANSTKAMSYRQKCPKDKNDVTPFVLTPPSSMGAWSSWGWQSCNEVGNIQVGDPENKLFGYNFYDDIQIKSCQANFPDNNFSREKIQNNVAKTNKYYKGKNVEGTCIIFLQGTWDPWQHDGITKDSELKSKDNSLIWIQNGQHWSDIYTPPSNIFKNTKNISQAQQSIQDRIGELLMKSC